jgi:hypothetical protein
MAVGPWRWVALFFTRPIQVSDLAAFVRSLKRRDKPATAIAAAPADEDDLAASRPRTRTPVSAAARLRGFPLRDPALDVGVSEQPLDTLPAELQSEFRSSGRGRLDAPPGDAGGASREPQR